jgi:RNA polymerase sigma-70 factor (ECF subfamily)
MLFSAWTETERRRLVGLCAALAGDRRVAEDLAQETLLEAWRHRHKLHDPAAADRWVAAIARNVCLRWVRRRGRELPVAECEPTELADELQRSELEEPLGRALTQLPPATRDVLVRHYVEGSQQAEIAARLGISEAAVSMRVSRGRAVLRRLLDAETGAAAEGAWEPTRVWCTACGAGRVEWRRDAAAVAFRCPGCSSTPSAVYELANPSFARLVGGAVRPTTVLRRAAEWSSRYFAGGAEDVACTRCQRTVRLRREDAERHGLAGTCGGCGERVWSSVVGLAHSLPQVRAFARDHGRVRTLPARDERHDGLDATVVRVEAVAGAAQLRAAFDRRTLRLLAVA